MQSRTFSRRTILRGIGATVALPLLDAAPAFGQGRRLTNQNRLADIYLRN